ncbi:Protein of unknown function [Gryllus bimaculatus]|nr:Protein of unknown function [Gryllus bimaculatus]
MQSLLATCCACRAAWSHFAQRPPPAFFRGGDALRGGNRRISLLRLIESALLLSTPIRYIEVSSEHSERLTGQAGGKCVRVVIRELRPKAEGAAMNRGADKPNYII